jgi:hypothetical protein
MRFRLVARIRQLEKRDEQSEGLNPFLGGDSSNNDVQIG